MRTRTKVGIAGIAGLVIFLLYVAVYLPGLMTAISRSKQKKTMATMESIGVSVRAHHRAKGSFPRTLGRVVDAWNNEIRYITPECSPDCQRFFLVSSGGDDQFEQTDPTAYTRQYMTGRGVDLVYSDRGWVRWPEGMDVGR